MTSCSFSKFYLFACTYLLSFSIVFSRKHQLVLENDIRRYFSVTTFGFFSDGRLEVNLNSLTFSPNSETFKNAFGLTLTRTVSDSITPYMESHQNKCLLLDDSLDNDGNIELVSFLLDFKNNEVLVNCSKLLSSLEISGYNPNSTSIELAPSVSNAEAPASRRLLFSDKKLILEKPSIDEINIGKDLTAPANEIQIPENQSKHTQIEPKHVTMSSVPKKHTCMPLKIPFKKEVGEQHIKVSNLKFVVSMDTPESEGLFSLYFHNCAGNGMGPTPVNLSISIIEQNGENFLSAGEILLPRLYFVLSVVFFFAGCIWVHVLKKKREETFKIHYLMSVLVFLKSLSLLFHGINFHIIAKDGYPMEAWAVLYYITHLLKGALLFITIVLIGTGWAFIKHILSHKDKKIFMIVIPLQVLANVAKIIMEESEEGESQHYTWREVFILVDLLCCGAILFPVVWSIRHLQEASQTDGKAAINLEKLKLFRHFYVMIVCYIYFTRIIVYLLKITVPFQYEWLDELFRETATLIFYIVTAYNFRPTTSNPYFRLSQEEEIEIDEVITQTGFTEGITKTVRSRESQGLDDNSMTTTKRESSHEYD